MAATGSLAVIPRELLPTGCTVQLSCFGCDHSGPLDVPASVARGEDLRHLLAMGVICCPACGGEHVLLVRGAEDSAAPLILSRNPHPVGLLASHKNVEIHGSAESVLIPYTRDGKDADRRAPYCDLKQQPHLLELLPEIQLAQQVAAECGGSGAFVGLLRQVNAMPDLTTLGCGWETTPYEGQYLTYGYVDIARHPLGERDYGAVRGRAEALMAALGEAASPSVKYLLTVKLGIHHLRPMFVLDVETVAAGATAHDAFLAWEDALDRLGAALGKG